MRPFDLADNAFDVVDGIDPHGFRHVGAGRHEKLRAFDRGIETVDAGGIGTRGNEEIRIAPRIQCRFQLGQHLLDRNDLLAG